MSESSDWAASVGVMRGWPGRRFIRLEPYQESEQHALFLQPTRIRRWERMHLSARAADDSLRLVPGTGEPLRGRKIPNDGSPGRTGAGAMVDPVRRPAPSPDRRVSRAPAAVGRRRLAAPPGTPPAGAAGAVPGVRVRPAGVAREMSRVRRGGGLRSDGGEGRIGRNTLIRLYASSNRHPLFNAGADHHGPPRGLPAGRRSQP